MKAEELREMNLDELQRKVIDLKQTYMNFRFQHEIGQLDNTSMIGRTRKDLARLMTVIREKQQETKA